jgi:propionate CoA-transferase
MGPKIMTAQDAVKLIPTGSTVLTEGFVGACFAEELAQALEQRFLETNNPRGLTLLYAAGQGDGVDRGLNHLGHEGLIQRVICGHLNLAPSIQKLVVENKVEAYNLPMGVISHMIRDSAAKKPGTITRVGLDTYVDPRLEGGKLNLSTQEDIIRLMEIDGEEYLFYKSFPVDVALLRGTYADELGNISMEKEGLYANMLAAAQACKNSGGLVIVQVENIVKAKTLDPRLVKIPGICVDIVVKAQESRNHMQTFASQYNPAFCGRIRVPVKSTPLMDMGVRKVISRRAAMELKTGAVVNLGIGMPEGVARIANELGRDDFVLTIEAGPIGGVPQGGLDFGCAINPWAIIDMPNQFDFYQGGGLDLTFLGLAQVDRAGNVNVSKFGSRIPGCGGFIDISQNAHKVVFCGTFTTKGFESKVEEGRLQIVQEGSQMKFLDQVEQITFSGKYAIKMDQEVLYVTERAVLQLTSQGLELLEYAPGIDIERDILAHMQFRPIIKNPAPMAKEIFQP